MSLLDRLERRFRRFAIPQLTRFLAMAQGAAWLLANVMPRQQGKPDLLETFLLFPDKVWQGEVWRLVTFLFYPPGTSILSLFGIYLFWLMGTALEGHWGTFRYNIYVLIATLATIAVTFGLQQGGPANNIFIGTSVFLAFAFLYPDFQLMLFFILPVRIKWLALLTWLGYGFTVIMGSWLSRLYVAASVLNFFLFFGRDVFWRMRFGKRSMESGFRAVTKGSQPFHRCRVCGLTEQDDPQADFRICSKCDGGTFEYCLEHLRSHEHRTKDVATMS